MLFQCSGQYQMILKFSCHGQMHRFPVGLIYDSIDSDQTNESFWVCIIIMAGHFGVLVLLLLLVYS